LTFLFAVDALSEGVDTVLDLSVKRISSFPEKQWLP
jgi:hypothetical protein